MIIFWFIEMNKDLLLGISEKKIIINKDKFWFKKEK